MKSLVVGLLVAAAIYGIYWLGWGRLTAGPPDAVVTAFLRATEGGDWGAAEAYMTQHVRGRLSSEGFDAMQRFVEARLESFQRFEIVRTAQRADTADVFVRFLLPIPPGADLSGSGPGVHAYPGRVVGSEFVHGHRFQLEYNGRAWRIYQFEETDDPTR